MDKLKSTILKRGSTLFLRLALYGLASIVLLICIFALPNMWVHIPDEYPDTTYVFYSILLALYIAAIPFFIAVFKALQLLRYIDKNKAFSTLSARALHHIAYCGVAIAVVFSGMSPFVFVWADSDDAPGLIVVNIMLIGAAITVSVFAAVVGQLLREAIALKRENDLTV